MCQFLLSKNNKSFYGAVSFSKAQFVCPDSNINVQPVDDNYEEFDTPNEESDTPNENDLESEIVPEGFVKIPAGTFRMGNTYVRNDWDAVTCDFSANGYRLPTEAEWVWDRISTIGGSKGEPSDPDFEDTPDNFDCTVFYRTNFERTLQPHNFYDFIGIRVVRTAK